MCFLGIYAVPLSIDFKSGDKIIINGAVIENLGANVRLSVHNQAAILRGKEVLSAEDSNTPASRVYFALQCAYIFPQNQDEYVESSKKLLTEYLGACPSAQPIVDEIFENISNEEIYKSLKSAQKLIVHEGEILSKLGAELDGVAVE
tara:strand:- start:1376 stop:1816 length:441 start_codon:yes stop_codon:yes gene_type:complete